MRRIGTALDRHPDWQSAPIIDAVDNLAALVQEDATPMMCKTDWSASNMLVRSNRVTCLYDFDTGYPGNHTTFLGDILCSASVRLNWPVVGAALASLGVALPCALLLATAAHFSRWQVQLARAAAAGNDLGWPGPARFVAHLERLTVLGASHPLRV